MENGLGSEFHDVLIKIAISLYKHASGSYSKAQLMIWNEDALAWFDSK